MLEMLRKGAKSWVAKGLILLLIASFAVWGIGDVFSTRLDSAVAEVGEREVTVDQFANALTRQRNQLSQQAGQAVSYADMRRIGFDRRVLSSLIRDAAFAEELDRLGISAPDAAVAESIRTNPAFQTASGGFSDPSYRLAVSRIGFTPSQFEELTRTLLGQQILTDAVTAAARPAPGFAPRLAAYQAERRTVEALLLTPDMAEAPGEPSGDALLDTYQSNQESYYEPERRWGRYLHVDMDRLMAENRPDEDAVRAEFDRNREAWSTPATRTIDQLPLPAENPDEVAAKVLTGEEPFEALALRLGEDPQALDLGTVERDDLPASTAEAVFEARAPGVIGPVQAPVGPVLIRIRAVTEGGTPPFEAVQGEIAARLARDAALTAATSTANRMEDQRAAGASFEEIAERTAAVLGRFEGLAQDGSLASGGEAEGIVGTQLFREEAFAALDLEEREILPTDAGGYLLVMVDRIEERSLPALTEIEDRVADDWRAAERLRALSARAESLADEIDAGRPFAEVAGDLGVEPIALGPVSRARPAPILPPELVEALFEADAGEAAAGRAADGSGVLIATVTAVEMPDAEEMETLTGRIESEAASLVAQDTQEYFARAVQESVPTEINPSVVDDVFSLLGAAPGSGG